MQSHKELQDSVKRSAENRKKVIQRFGFVPKSVIRDIHRGKLSSRMHIYQHEEPSRSAFRKEEERADVARKAAAGIKNSATKHGNGRGSQNATIMPAELVEFFVKYYMSQGGTYLDPFAGQGIRMQVAKLLGVNYRGYDLSNEFMRYNLAVRDKIDDGETVIQLVHGDSRTPTEIPDDIGDFCFTSPPYWDIEDYGDEPEQLGRRSYDDFLAGMKQVAEGWFPKFRDGAYITINVNDFRKGGKYYSYHADTIRVFESAGYTMYDTWIIEGLVGGLPKSFAVSYTMKRLAPKIHEYVLVFRK